MRISETEQKLKRRIWKSAVCSQKSRLTAVDGFLHRLALGRKTQALWPGKSLTHISELDSAHCRHQYIKMTTHLKDGSLTNTGPPREVFLWVQLPGHSEAIEVTVCGGGGACILLKLVSDLGITHTVLVCMYSGCKRDRSWSLWLYFWFYKGLHLRAYLESQRRLSNQDFWDTSGLLRIHFSLWEMDMSLWGH